jgi:hypothetical protein
MVEVFTPEEALKKIVQYQTTPQWVLDARERSSEFKALVTGEKFSDLLINRIESIESSKRAIARRKYSKDIRDMFDRVFKKRYNVFEAVGGSEVVKIESETLKAQFETIANNFKGQKSIEKYLSDTFFNLWDVDPNGVLFLEYKIEDGQIECYPTYKSINDIRYYDADGQEIEYIIFEPKFVKTESNLLSKMWRFVDSENEYFFIQDGSSFRFLEEKSFKHEFKQVPGVIISDNQIVGSHIRRSMVDQVSELAKDYARDKSVLTIYKFQNGFPIHWRYEQKCRPCQGTGKTGSESCKICNGKGILQKSDVTDVVSVTPPREGDPVLTPNVAGYVNPSIEVWKQYNDDLKQMELKIESTIWGTMEAAAQNDTATGKFIDTQPITNELSKLSSNVEFVHNFLAKMVLRLITPVETDKIYYYKSYGRRYIIESPDTILNKYNESKEKGDPVTILDRLLNEFIVAKYKSDLYMQNVQLKKAVLEPYIHQTVEDIDKLFGKKEAYKKAIFADFWQSADHSKSVDQLETDFNVYVEEQITKNNILPNKSEADQKLLNILETVSPIVANKMLESLTVNEIRGIFKLGSIPEGDVLPGANQSFPTN